MRLLLALVLLSAACGDDPAPVQRAELDARADLVADQAPDIEDTPDLAEDAAPDLVEDMMPDIADATPDLAQDMTPDVAPDMACECSSGPCCDGCMFKSVDVVCTDRWTKMVCEGASSGSATYYNRYCDGLSATCEGRLEERGTLPADCSPGRCRAGEGDRWLICTAG